MANDVISPLVIGLGGAGCDLVASLKRCGYETLLVDTDRRTGRRHPGSEVMIIGKALVSGEGCGGNMNLGKACFKTNMDPILSRIATHRPILTVSYPGGGTGTPGAVEISTMLDRFKIPHFNFLVCRRGPSTGGMDPFGMGEFLLKGPLGPGSLISVDTSIGPPTVEDEPRLAQAVHLLASSSSSTAHSVLPISSWGELAGSETLIRSYLLEFDPSDAIALPIFDQEQPVTLSLSVPEEISNDELMEVVGRILPPQSKRAVGVTLSPPGMPITAAILHPGGGIPSAAPQNPYQPPPDLMEILKSDALTTDDAFITTEQ